VCISGSRNPGLRRANKNVSEFRGQANMTLGKQQIDQFSNETELQNENPTPAIFGHVSLYRDPTAS
jgi:hypothetical protein